MSVTHLTNEVHNKGLFWNFDILMDYFAYFIQIQGVKWLLSLNIMIKGPISLILKEELFSWIW